MKQIPIGVSNRHVHLTSEDLEKLFGEGYELLVAKELSQPGEFAAKETVTIKTEKAEIPKVRILGPIRKFTQVEISKTDARKLGVDAQIRASGNIDGTPGITLIGPKGSLKIEKGVIIAERHIHMTPQDAEKFQVKDGQYASVKVEGNRGLIFNQVLIRVKDTYALDMHIDTDEANSGNITTGDLGHLLQ
ncbi:phosphate propanoyltransferase [Bacillus pseudomycoides]|uniref:phosphate propanoyltransferase n=1 Tax=Bacillus pseudomycoides TaxID=64104 RepID=UPI000BED4A38|nr:phosphate propanoyltransferase [Bacillus pseudomycoides]MED4651809.1 phosphate propanoyltransferase [Bacillus pseudomycoides]PEE05114.1 propanediol utilization protein [Bacillus pseudomycoides]PEM80346.1 propanediol utilization protein [Bacillus pseudomycoides]PHC85881.1 propanediol utilization protein [Bacillus pseudomycoides]